MPKIKYIKLLAVISIVAIFVSTNFVWAQSQNTTPPEEIGWFGYGARDPKVYPVPSWVTKCSDNDLKNLKDFQNCIAQTLDITVLDVYKLNKPPACTQVVNGWVCNPDTFIKTYLQYTDLLEKVGFRRVNYDPTATTTTTKPVTTTKSINTTKPVTKVTNRVVRTGIVVDKDVNIVVIQSQKVVNTWQSFLRWIGIVKTEKVEYIIWNSPSTIVRDSITRTSKNTMNFEDIQINNKITVTGELTKEADQGVRGEIISQSIMVQPYKVSVTTKTTVPITTKPSNITTFVPQENQKNTTSTTIQQIRLPWQINKETNIPGVTVNTLSKQGSLYKLKECASDGEPILKVVGVGITENPPTKCCEGLKLCSFLVTDEKEFIEYQGVLSQILGYCKISCPENDTTKDLLPNPTKPKTLLESISDWFKPQVKECYTNKDCENKYCIKYPSSFIPLNNNVSTSIIPLCNYYCSTEGKCEKLDLGIITPNATSTSDTIEPNMPITDISCKDSSECILCNGACFSKKLWSNMEQLGIKCEVNATDKNKKCECNAQNICMLVNLSDTSTSTTSRSNITLPNTCTNVYSPVCGYDNKTYQNRCELDRANIQFKYTGVCTTTTTKALPQPGRCFTNSDCVWFGDRCIATNMKAEVEKSLGFYYPFVYKKPANLNCVCLSSAPGNSMLGFYCSAEPVGVIGIPSTSTTTITVPTSPSSSTTTSTTMTTIPQYSCECPDIYQPVCGIDNKTYNNACYAGCVHIQIKREGVCEEAPNVPSTTIPQYSCECPDIYQPVCGIDNKTYNNACNAGCVHIQIKREGVCEEAPIVPDTTIPPNIIPPTTIPIITPPTTQPLICIALWDPVCGVDGQTYSNDCYAQAAGVAVKCQGECPCE